MLTVNQSSNPRGRDLKVYKALTVQSGNFNDVYMSRHIFTLMKNKCFFVFFVQYNEYRAKSTLKWLIHFVSGVQT